MNQQKLFLALWLPCAVLVLYLAAIFFRPLLPIDETRYMSVAWEMLLHHGWFKPLTLNFEPYHHKPPLLFWLINLSWAIFGVSRWAGLIPVALSSMLCVYLTGILGKNLFPDMPQIRHRSSLVMVASVPFLMYGTIVMFDFTLTVFVLLSVICIIKYRQKQDVRLLMLTGVFLGMGVLAKGPVAYLYVLFPLLLAPVWINDFQYPRRWYLGIFLIIVISALPVLCWLVPVLLQADGNFAFWLIWNQTAGRVTGNFSDAHLRPFYFYLPFLPVMVIPWIFFPGFWRGLLTLRKHAMNAEGLRFLFCLIVPAFLVFCIIRGKQPHYLIPFLPGIAILVAVSLNRLKSRTLAVTAFGMISFIVLGQAVASRDFIKSYDLRPIAIYVQSHPDHDWAFVNNYHAEFGFLARLQKPVADVNLEDLPVWFAAHPNGLAIIHYDGAQQIAGFKMMQDDSYRSGSRLGIFSR